MQHLKNARKNSKKICTSLLTLSVMLATVLALHFQPLYALEDGAYLVTRTTSYKNPETGKTVDGGTNIELGDSMCNSIVDTYLLVEQVSGKTYVTIGIGQMSNVSNVRINIQTSAGGGYQPVTITQTGSSNKDGDLCNHYRFEVVSTDLYISPILHVGPMGRDVQFFVKLNSGSASAGTGVFNAQMASTIGQSPTNEQGEQVKTEQSENSVENIEKMDASKIKIRTFDELYKQAKGLSIYKVKEKKSKNNIPWGIIGGSVICFIGCGYVLYIKKFKGNFRKHIGGEK